MSVQKVTATTTMRFRRDCASSLPSSEASMYIDIDIDIYIDIYIYTSFAKKRDLRHNLSEISLLSSRALFELTFENFRPKNLILDQTLS